MAQFYLGGMLNYVEIATSRHAGEQDVAADSGLVFRIVLRRYRGLGIGLNFSLRIVVLHAILQGTNAFAQTLAQFGQFLGAEHQQCDGEDYQQVHGLKQTFKHKASEPDMPTGMPDSTTTM